MHDTPAAPIRPRKARLLLRTHRYGALSTLSKKFDGHPFGSMTPYLTDHDGSLLILISDLAEHSKNIRHDPRVSLLTHDQEDTRIEAQERVTVIGQATQVTDPDSVARRYLRYFPAAEDYLSLADFRFYRIVPQAVRYIAGFGAAYWVQAGAFLLPTPLTGAAEDVLIAELRDALAPDELVGVDNDGYDLRRAGRLIRHHFPTVLNDTDAIAAILRKG